LYKSQSQREIMIDVVEIVVDMVMIEVDTIAVL
jgi:hypothetical protein